MTQKLIIEVLRNSVTKKISILGTLTEEDDAKLTALIPKLSKNANKQFEETIGMNALNLDDYINNELKDLLEEGYSFVSANEIFENTKFINIDWLKDYRKQTEIKDT